MNPELLKILIIVGSGIVLGAIGQIIILKRKKAKEQMQYDEYGFDSTISQNEQTAKDYIAQYKNQYPRDAIKQGLLQTGMSESESEMYLNKYF